MLKQEAGSLLSPRTAMLYFAAFLVLGTYLRFSQLGDPSLWIDELNHHYAAETYLQNGKMTLPSGQPNERAWLYSFMIAGAFKVFGPTPFAVRFPSALFGVLCIALSAFMALRFFGRTTAVLTTLFVAISPFAIGWSRISRFYTLFQFIFMAGLYAFYLGYERGHIGRARDLQKRLLERLRAGTIGRLLEEHRINLFWLAAAAVLFFAAYKVHRLTAIFPVSLGFYCAFMFARDVLQQGVMRAVLGKYSLTLLTMFVGGLLMLLTVPALQDYVLHWATYAPKWAEGTRFEDRKLFLNFLFDTYQFPMGVLFVIGAYQIVARASGRGLYALAVFLGPLFMFVAVLAYRHFQYLFNVYSLFTMIAAYAFANIIYSELPRLRENWFRGARFSRAAVGGLILLLFLAWLPAAPSVRLARRIPLDPEGSFNGAMFLEEWREAIDYAKPLVDGDDVVISSDALGTLHYLGRVDYDLNFADFDLAQVEKLQRADGTHFDLYSGAPFVESLEQLRQIFDENETVWLLFQEYKLMRSDAYTPPEIRAYILENAEKVYSTRKNTVLIYRFQRPASEGPSD